MKYLFLVVWIGVFAINASAQNISQPYPKLSPTTQLYLHKLRSLNESTTLPGYVYCYNTDKQLCLKAMVKMAPNPQNAENEMRVLGAHIGTRAGSIWTVQIPVRNISAFTKIKGITYIQLDEPIAMQLDEARRLTRADSVHQGIGLIQPYTGKGVVMGVIDAGFDYTHPTFYDTLGTTHRVTKVWEQKSIGTPPVGFSYGNEITGTANILAKASDNDLTHGTHVAGIAGGSGVGGSSNNRQFRGFAYESELVFVGITPPKSQWISSGSSDILDGVNYIFKYAADQGKPAVANLSWGAPAGPLDGTSLFGQACDALVGAGKIFVCSGGNNGENRIHIGKTFTATDTIVHTFLAIETNPIGKQTWVDMWGEAGKIFCAQVRLFHKGNAIDSTGFICLDNSMHNKYLIGSNNDTCFVDIVTSSSEFNGKPRLFMTFNSKVTDSIAISLKANSGTVNFLNSFVHETIGYYGSLESYGFSWATSGNTNMTISDMATTKNAIAVGAYASKTSFTNLNGQSISYAGYVSKQQLVPFSSRGPAADGRVKPDITGPGLALASAVSSYDPSYVSGGDMYGYNLHAYVSPVNGRTYHYAGLSGTSMSSPATSGIVALMLQANPQLTPDATKAILFETAIKDIYTGTIPTTGNNNWGHGKVNAYGAIKKSWQTSSVKKMKSSNKLFSVFPNPGAGRFVMEYKTEKSETVMVSVSDVTGKTLLIENRKAVKGVNVYQLDISGYAKGVYLARLQNGKESNSIKLILE